MTDAPRRANRVAGGVMQMGYASEGLQRDFVRRILGVESFAGFLDQNWEATPKYVPGACSMPAEILGHRDIERVLAAGNRSAQGVPSIVENQIAQPLPDGCDTACWLDLAADAFARGATLLVPGLQRSSDRIGTLCRLFDNAFLSHGIPLAKAIFANAYLTPAATQGFGAHYDDHCVLVLQISGTKSWVVNAPDHALPVNRCTSVVPDDALGKPILEVTLQSGDVLYIPRGFPHSARSTEQTSLHLTLGMHTKPWSSILAPLANHAQEMRASIRPIEPDRDPATVPLGDHIIRHLATVDPSGVIMGLISESLSSLPPLAGERIETLTNAVLSQDTELARASEVLVMLSNRGERVALHHPGGKIELPQAAHDALAFVADTDVFKVSDIPEGKAAFDKVELAKLLIRKGIVTITRTDTQEIAVVRDSAEKKAEHDVV